VYSVYLEAVLVDERDGRNPVAMKRIATPRRIIKDEADGLALALAAATRDLMAGAETHFAPIMASTPLPSAAAGHAT
jgi:hypothetical protein